MASMAAFRLLKRGLFWQQRAGLSFPVGNRHSHGHGAEHQALCDGLGEGMEMDSKHTGKSSRSVSGFILSLATHKQAQGDEIEGDSAAEVVAAG